MSEISQLKGYVEADTEKITLLEGLMPRAVELHKMDIDQKLSNKLESCFEENVCLEKSIEVSPDKFCPKCGKRFMEGENFCPDCLVTLKTITDMIDVKEISVTPDMEYVKERNLDDVLTQESIDLINAFDFDFDDFKRIMHSIKSQSFRNLDSLINENSLKLDDMDVLDKVILFAKSFITVEYKSFGGELGYFEFNRIYVDDRQRKSLQITTLIHELTHFLVKEILTRTVCEILGCTKNSHVESVVTYILSNSVFNNLIDEYAAHSVEGRFTIFGYQDYSSFMALQEDLEAEYIDMAKTIGNTFSIHIKDLMEGFLDWDMREEIKDQFLSDTIERPDYSQLRFESSSKLSDEGFMKAIWLILSEGFQSADKEVIAGYEIQFNHE